MGLTLAGWEWMGLGALILGVVKGRSAGDGGAARPMRRPGDGVAAAVRAQERRPGPPRV